MSRDGSTLRTLAMLLVLTGCGACATGNDQPPQQRQLQQAVAAPRRSSEPQFIPDAARALLRLRMKSHAQNMSGLMSAVAVLRYPEAAALAESILDDAGLARPITGDAAELNTLLPPAYFLLQDDLRADARAAREAAQRTDAIALGKAYGRLAEGCVSCHALFRPALSSSGAVPVR